MHARALAVAPALLLVSLAGCSKSGNCTGVHTDDPPLCINLPPADYKAEKPNRYPHGGQVMIQGSSPDKGSILLSWYPPEDESTAQGAYNGAKNAAKGATAGKTTGAPGDWYTATANGSTSFGSLVKIDKWFVFCNSSIGASSPAAKHLVEACKSLR